MTKYHWQNLIWYSNECSAYDGFTFAGAQLVCCCKPKVQYILLIRFYSAVFCGRVGFGHFYRIIHCWLNIEFDNIILITKIYISKWYSIPVL